MSTKQIVKAKSGAAIDWLKNLPNKLTLARILAAPLLILLYSLDFRFLDLLSALIFLLAALTDFFDGFIARRYHLESEFGALLDPIADKVLMATCLILLASLGVAPAWMVSLLICRELLVSGIRLVAAERRMTIAVNQFGKLKTVAQAVAIFCLFLNRPLFDLPIREIGMVSLWLALGLSAYSAYTYWMLFWTTNKSSLQ